MYVNKFTAIDGVEVVMTTDLKGNILETTKFPHEENIALMSQFLFAKSNIFLKDFVNHYMEQLIFKFKKGFVLVSKIDDDKILLILSSSKSNLGILLKETNP